MNESWTLYTYCKKFYICYTFMKRVEYIRSSVNMMIALLLICSIVCNSFVSAPYNSTVYKLVCLENPNSHSQPVTPLPEKVESENDYKHQIHFFFIQQLITFIPLNSPELRHSHFDAFCFHGNIPGIPLFLSKRSFLIWPDRQLSAVRHPPIIFFYSFFQSVTLLISIQNIVWTRKILFLVSTKYCMNWSIIYQLRHR